MFRNSFFHLTFDSKKMTLNFLKTKSTRQLISSLKKKSKKYYAKKIVH